MKIHEAIKAALWEIEAGNLDGETIEAFAERARKRAAEALIQIAASEGRPIFLGQALNEGDGVYRP